MPDARRAVAWAQTHAAAAPGSAPAGFPRVARAGPLDESAVVHFVWHRLIPEYLRRLPGGRDCRAIRELLTGEDADGQPQPLRADALAQALSRGTYVSILLLHPDPGIARLRGQALQGTAQSRMREDRVRPGIRHSLDVLAAVSAMIDDDCRRHLRVRLYDSLPSISVYSIDDRAFVSVFAQSATA